LLNLISLQNGFWNFSCDIDAIFSWKFRSFFPILIFPKVQNFGQESVISGIIFSSGRVRGSELRPRGCKCVLFSSGRSFRVGFCHRLICCCCRDSFLQKKQVHRQLLRNLTKNHFPKFDGFRFSKPSWQHLFNLELQRQQQILNHNLELLQ
jgi:hypothetical protein